MSFIKNKQIRLSNDTKTSLGDIIQIDDDLFIVSSLEPLELIAIEHYGREETGDSGELSS